MTSQKPDILSEACEPFFGRSRHVTGIFTITPIGKVVVNSELERMWKEVVEALSEIFFGVCLEEGLRETTKPSGTIADLPVEI
jgi:hypothetical protein